ncbi:sso2 [Trichoderma arundinaceum]|uniref:Sso2 n=1 Tax=Trichoderma arundinaceum TaxID=490622 RepID=A0A395NGL5_TRIAR|nr:sso2 [Trichoderma arundinaceum]
MGEIRAGIDEIDQKVDELELLQRQTLVNPNSSTSGSANEELDNLGSGIKALCHSLTDRVYKVKNSPAGHQLNSAQQIGSILNRIRGVISRFEQVKATHRQKLQAQIARQYRVVRPDASEEEVQAAVEGSIDPQQIFQRAILGSIRHGEAQAALESVKDRHAQVQKIEEEMTEIAELFENLNTLVVQQERPIAQSQQMNEEAVKNLDLGSQEMDVAVGNARKMRKKKWLCLGMAGP